MIDNSKLLVCPVCQGTRFYLKYEAAYVYSYLIDTDAPGLKNSQEFFSFLYDNREQIDSKQYVQCDYCGSKFRCYFNQWDQRVGIKDLQAAIYSDPNLKEHLLST